jgi:hypothetical protein
MMNLRKQMEELLAKPWPVLRPSEKLARLEWIEKMESGGHPIVVSKPEFVGKILDRSYLKIPMAEPPVVGWTIYETVAPIIVNKRGVGWRGRLRRFWWWMRGFFCHEQ